MGNGYTNRQEIERLYEAACEVAKEFNKAQKEVLCDLDLTDMGREKKLNQMRERAEDKIKGYLMTAANNLQSARERLEKARVTKSKALLTDAAYQLSLANTIRAMELRGRMMTDGELRELAEPFAEDAHARATITAAAKAGGADPLRVNDVLDPVFRGLETRDKVTGGLLVVENFIRKVWEDYRLSLNGLEVQSAMQIILDKHAAALEGAALN